MQNYSDAYNGVEACETSSQANRLPVGGYVVKILGVENVEDKQYLKIRYDITEGNYKGYYGEKFGKFGGNWQGILVRSYKESAMSYFKGFTTSVEKSNIGYKWNWDEQSLVGKLVGIVYGEEEYENRSGEVKTRLYVVRNTSVDNIRKHNYETPTEVKSLRKPVVMSQSDVYGFSTPNEPNVAAGITDMQSSVIDYGTVNDDLPF